MPQNDAQRMAGAHSSLVLAKPYSYFMRVFYEQDYYDRNI